MTDPVRAPVWSPTGFVWTFPADVVRVIDADTLICNIKLHPNEGGEVHEVNVRVFGINAPELNTAEGQTAKRYVEDQVALYGSRVMLAASKREKYGRFLARVTLSDGSDLSSLVIAAGHAVPYLT